jgi:hypothetical protein
VLIRGARSTTFTSSTLLLATSITMFSSIGAFRPTFTLSCRNVCILGAVARTLKTPGSSTGKRKAPSELV